MTHKRTIALSPSVSPWFCDVTAQTLGFDRLLPVPSTTKEADRLAKAIGAPNHHVVVLDNGDMPAAHKDMLTGAGSTIGRDSTCSAGLMFAPCSDWPEPHLSPAMTAALDDYWEAFNAWERTALEWNEFWDKQEGKADTNARGKAMRAKFDAAYARPAVSFQCLVETPCTNADDTENKQGMIEIALQEHDILSHFDTDETEALIFALAGVTLPTSN